VTAEGSPEITEVASGFRFPEGPVCLPDGSLLVAQLGGGCVSRVGADGAVTEVARPGGSPNGLAVGPDGACYVCNSGGWEFREVAGMLVTGILQPADYSGGRIERVDLATGAVDVLYRECDGHPLRGPNDIVFDAHGGMWFTDFGKQRARERDHGFVYYAAADGSAIREVLGGLDTPNGIGLSPDGSELYVAETTTGRLWAWRITEPGHVEGEGGFGVLGSGARLVCGLPGLQWFDSLAVDDGGYVVVATLLNGGLTVAASDGSSIEHVALPDPIVTNVCFGGPDRRTAYATLSGSGRLVSFEWPRPGLALAY
jgi:gluconolactonase